VLLKGARIITMEGDQVIEKWGHPCREHRIKAIAPRVRCRARGGQGSGCNGKTIVPGFVDTHAHMWPQWGVHKNQVWKYAINLAYASRRRVTRRRALRMC